MITLLENGVGAFLQAIIDGGGLSAPAKAVSAVNKDIAPGDRTIVVVMISDLPHDGGQHYRAMLRITVESPADVPTITPATHAAVEQLVTAAFVPANAAALDAAVQAAAPAWKTGGFFVNGWQPARQDTEWQPHFDVILGIVPAS